MICFVPQPCIIRNTKYDTLRENTVMKFLSFSAKSGVNNKFLSILCCHLKTLVIEQYLKGKPMYIFERDDAHAIERSEFVVFSGSNGLDEQACIHSVTANTPKASRSQCLPLFSLKASSALLNFSSP